MNKAAADEKLQSLVDARSKEGYKIVFERRGYKPVLMIDKSKNLQFYERSWMLTYWIHNSAIMIEDLKKVRVSISPAGLHSTYNEYSLGGLMLGGVSGLLIGSIIDSLRGPRTEDVAVNFVFKSREEDIYYTPYYESKVTMVEEEVERVFKGVVSVIDRIKALYPDHVVL